MKRIIFLLSILLIFSRCYTPISSIVKNPQLYEGQKVRIQGYVAGGAILTGTNLIYVQEFGGKAIIAVATKQIPPNNGELISIKGIVNPNFKYKLDSMLVIEEIPKKNRKKFKKRLKYEYTSNKFLKPKENPYILQN